MSQNGADSSETVNYIFTAGSTSIY